MKLVFAALYWGLIFTLDINQHTTSWRTVTGLSSLSCCGDLQLVQAREAPLRFYARAVVAPQKKARLMTAPFPSVRNRRFPIMKLSLSEW